MQLVSENVEYRRTNEVEGKNGKYYLHSFEDDNGAFTFYCPHPVNCKKGDTVKLVFSVSLFDGKPNFKMEGIFADGK